MAKEEKPKRVGIDWPEECEGKTTGPAKLVWAACAEVGGSPELAKRIMKEKNWRFGYPAHIQEVAELLAKPDKAVPIAKQGLKNLREQLIFRDKDLNCKSLEEVARQPVPKKQDYFTTKIAQAQERQTVPDQFRIPIPYQGANLANEALSTQLHSWANYGTCEPDCILKITKAEQKLWALQNKWFVLLGAGSELGPLEPLLEAGANVIAIRTRRAKEWEKMEEFAKKTKHGGKLFIPVNKGLSASGADILAEPLEIRNWILEILTENSVSEVTIGMYTYLDAEAHVRVTLGCDLIMEGVQTEMLKRNQANVVRFAYLCTNSMPLPIGKEAFESIEVNRGAAPLAVRASRCPGNNVSEIVEDDMYLYHCIFEAQGPNYILAKFAQLWRAVVATQTSPVSLNVAPACYTVSVTHAPTMKYLLNAMHLLAPQEAFQPETARSLMFHLLAFDVCCAAEDNKVELEQIKQNPYKLAQFGSFHGGSLRCGFNIEKSKILGGLLYAYGRFVVG
ncbi:unnamed protein product [Amoebophrya sp. A120]|nr:unnamed protein product [Amoebophrya sp. A120]|eukprot:GSA120T00009237001.1